MKISRNITLFRNLALLLFLSLLAGCLTSPNPFYNENDIIQDARFSGFFVYEESGLTVTISSEGRTKKSYLVSLADFGGKAKYRATLFKLKDSVFADVTPISEGKDFKTSIEGYPSANGLLQGVSHDGKISSAARLHVLFRLSISDQGIECFCAKSMSDTSNPIPKDSNLKFHANKAESISSAPPDNIVLDEPTERLRSVLESYAGTNWGQVFQSQPDYSEDSVLELIRTNKEKFLTHSDKVDCEAFSLSLPYAWDEINKGETPPPNWPYLRFQGPGSGEFGVAIYQKSGGDSVGSLVNKCRNGFTHEVEFQGTQATITGITNWSRYNGQGFNIVFKPQGEFPGEHVTIFGFEKGDSICIIYEETTLTDFKQMEKDFEKFRKTFQLK